MDSARQSQQNIIFFVNLKRKYCQTTIWKLTRSVTDSRHFFSVNINSSTIGVPIEFEKKK